MKITSVSVHKVSGENSRMRGIATVVLDDCFKIKGIRIIEKGLSENGSFWGPGVVLYIENNSEQDITVQVRDVSINGYMVESMISEEVLIGKKSITDLQFLSNDLKENDITKIEDIEFYFHIFNWKDYDSIYDSDIIKLSY